MQPNEYQKEANKTRHPFDDKAEQLLFAVMEVNSEAGELANLLYKHLWQEHPRDDHKLLLELGDIAWGLAVAADALGYTFDEVLQANIDKLRRRYPLGNWSRQDSIQRVDTVQANTQAANRLAPEVHQSTAVVGASPVLQTDKSRYVKETNRYLPVNTWRVHQIRCVDCDTLLYETNLRMGDPSPDLPIQVANHLRSTGHTLSYRWEQLEIPSDTAPKQLADGGREEPPMEKEETAPWRYQRSVSPTYQEGDGEEEGLDGKEEGLDDEA